RIMDDWGKNHAGPDRPTPSHNYRIKGYEESNGATGGAAASYGYELARHASAPTEESGVLAPISRICPMF
ncbi:hypothetical protein, partial [Cryobacterium sp. TMT4-31]|uniref:hypothetical protein n=1 Tax=Cryobacterium sp. TMT4-31 TaxID=1259259 RepID=UPI001A7E0614